MDGIRFYKDLGLPHRGVRSLTSRLTYDNSPINDVEGFGRFDTKFGFLVKGLIGGGFGGGSLNDEDWDLDFQENDVAYSNALSDVDNNIHYGIVDVGYALWRGAAYSIAPFVGYTQFEQDMAGLGCGQIAKPYSDCDPRIASNIRGITEDDKWHGLRLGAVVDVMLTSRLSLTGDAAYLPYVKFKGMDDYILRNLVSPEDGEGIGVQLEATLSYAVTDAFSSVLAAVIGRYGQQTALSISVVRERSFPCAMPSSWRTFWCKVPINSPSTPEINQCALACGQESAKQLV